MIVTTSFWNNLALTSLTEKINSGGYTGPLNGLTLILFQNSLLLTPATTLSQLVEATYSGYARVTPVGWNTAVLQADGSYTILSSLANFVATGASNFAGCTIFGWALIDAANDLMMAETLAAPIPIANPGGGFGLVIEYNFGPRNPASFGQILA